LVFEERGKPEFPIKTSRSRVENQRAQSTYDVGSGWKASALTTAPTLLPMDTEPRKECPSTPGTSVTIPSVEKIEIDGVSCLMNLFTNYNIS